MRWQGLASPLTGADEAPTAQLLKLAELAGAAAAAIPAAWMPPARAAQLAQRGRAPIRH